ncbi:MAG: DNA-processing protein DprA [Clostridia bacterium]|nr:DNA-processing protein DprA [Clostridia bacterium]
MEDMIIYWIWLSLACNPSGSTFGKLIKEFDGAKKIYEADGRRVSSIIGFRNSDRTNLENKSLDKAEEVYRFCTKHKVGLLPYCDERYPELLRQIDNPPVLLYYRGVLPDFDKIFTVSAVGTRSLSDYGRRNAFNIGHDLAMAGATVVSGMAIGIDGVAMAGALAAGGTTVAVIGSGIDVCYPPQHLRLAREIVKRGCVLTEFAPGTQPNKFNFPKRNRIISGLSRATVVFEGAERSGALITARYAKEQGRTVYALPGNVGSKNSQLSNLLIKNGAKICTSAEDVLNDFKDSYRGVINTFLLKDRVGVDMMSTLTEYGVVAVCPGDDIFVAPKPKKSRENKVMVEATVITEEAAEPVSPPISFDKTALAVYKRIPESGSCSLEELVDENTDLRQVMKCLLKLEMGGFVVMLPGEKVSRKFKSI